MQALPTILADSPDDCIDPKEYFTAYLETDFEKQTAMLRELSRRSEEMFDKNIKFSRRIADLLDEYIQVGHLSEYL